LIRGERAIASLQEIYQGENDVYLSSISIQELYEFLTVEYQEKEAEVYDKNLTFCRLG
jgi:predicted nucleic acid-binding protein